MELDHAKDIPSPYAEEGPQAIPSPLAGQGQQVIPSPLAGEGQQVIPSPLAWEGEGGGHKPLLDEILTAYLKAIDAGQTPDRQDLLARYPHLATDLQDFFADQDQVLRFTEPLRAAVQAADTPNDMTGFPAGSLLGQFGDYELLEVLAQGGMGVVYKARQRSLNRLVALKMIRSGPLATPADAQRFRNEAETVASLSHPHIVPIHEVGEYQGQLYLSLKFIDGGCLAEQLPRFAADARAAARLVATLAQAIHYAHQHGVLHRDLKPSNILLDREGQPYVTDFGLAKRLEADPGLTQSGALLGTPSYMAPEQAFGRRGTITTATDIYGLGTILYTLLSGRPPFQAETALETLDQVKVREPEPPSRNNAEVVRDLETICLKCLRKEPDQRYASAEALAEDLARFLEDKPIRARRLPWWQRAAKWTRRHRILVAAGAALCVLSATALTAGRVLVVREQAAARQRDDARAEAARSADAERVTRTVFYLDNMGQAFAAWKRGDFHEVGQFLQRYQASQLGGQPNSSVRGFEWYYLSWLLRGGPYLVASLQGHRGEVYGVAFSADGETLASAGQDRTVRLWDTSSRKCRKVFYGHSDEINGVAFSPNGTVLATGSDDRTVRLWDVASGKERGVLRRHGHHVLSVAFAPDGKLLASGSRDRTVRLWDVSARRVVQSLDVPGDVQELAFATDERELAAACGEILSWRLRPDGMPISPSAPLVNPYGASMSVAFAPGGGRMASGHVTGAVSVWNRGTAQRERDWQAHASVVNSLAFSPDGTTLLTAASDGAIRAWQSRLGVMERQWQGHENGIWCVAFSPKGDCFATAGRDGAVKLWKLQNAVRDHVRLRSSVPHLWRMAVVPRSTKIITAHDPIGKVVLWDWVTAETEIVCDTRASPELSGLAVSSDGATMILGLGNGEIQFWDLSQRRLRRTFRAHQGFIDALTLAPDGRHMATAGRDDRALRIWDLGTDPPSVTTLDTEGISRRGLAFSPDSRILALGGIRSGALELWDISSATPRHLSQMGSHHGLRCLQFSPDGTTLATAGADRILRLWNVSSGIQGALRASAYDASTDGSEEGPIQSITFSPDGRNLALLVHNDGSVVPGSHVAIKVVNVATGLIPLTFTCSPQRVGEIAFSADGTVLAGAANGATDKGPAEINLWFAPREERSTQPAVPQGER